MNIIKQSILVLAVFALFVTLLVKIQPDITTSVDEFLAQALPQAPGQFNQEPIARCADDRPEIVLSWTPSKNTSGYFIYRKPVSQKNWKDASVSAKITNTSYIDTNLSNTASAYTYRIRAVNKLRKAYSNEQTAIVTACPSATPVITQSVIPQITSTSTIQEWGAYAGWQDNSMLDFESRVGKKVKNYVTFTHWGNENQFPSHLALTTRDAGKILVIFWEAMDYNASYLQSNFSYDAINGGAWDEYIASFAQSAAAYAGPVILIPFEEMNGDWSPWSITLNSNNAVKHITAYRRIRNMFRNAPNVKFAWVVNNDAVPDIADNQFENFYPGDEYVDYVGVNGFNFGSPWQTFDQIFKDALNRLALYKKPLYIFSMASAEGAQKAAWIKNALGEELPKHPEVRGWMWFNEKKERDWRVWSDAESLDAFKASLP